MGQQLMGEQQKAPSEHKSGNSHKKHLFVDNNGQHIDAKSASGQSSNKNLPNQFKINAPSQIVKASPVHQRNPPVSQFNRMDYSQTESLAHSQIPPAERYPTKISYFNAWSLPIQKYYKDNRGPYEPQEEPAAVQERREMREFNSEALEELMAEQMKRQIANNNNRKRRQNLNMV